uniref:Chromo domain-containing protein n=1 Tax=viral metagenome TaxID=1070528 RepID=A0A6C0HXY1_9ZZZZ
MSEFEESEGFVYCLTNESMPGLVKVGETHTEGITPEDRASQLYKTGVPLPFKVEFAKKVKNPRQKENILHKLLEKYTSRPNGSREFFSTTPDEVRLFFDLIDGEMWAGGDETSKTYNIEKILEHRGGGGVKLNRLREAEFLVRWEGGVRTWEPYSGVKNVIFVIDYIEKYREKIQKLKIKKRKFGGDNY